MFNASKHLKHFYKLSVALTGFKKVDLLGTGVGREYLDELVHGAGELNVGDLLGAAKKVGKSTSALRKTILDDDRFGPMARNIILMWYLGSWYPLPNFWHKKYRPESEAGDERVVSAAAYQEGLVWSAIGAHPRGAKPPGFGSWGRPPGESNENSEPKPRPPKSSKPKPGKSKSG